MSEIKKGSIVSVKGRVVKTRLDEGRDFSEEKYLVELGEDDKTVWLYAGELELVSNPVPPEPDTKLLRVGSSLFERSSDGSWGNSDEYYESWEELYNEVTAIGMSISALTETKLNLVVTE